MASVRMRALRAAAACPLLGCARGVKVHVGQRRWAQVHDVRLRFLATTRLPDQVVLNKYRAKLEQKARQEGHDGVDSLRSAYADRIAAQRRRDAVRLPVADAPPTPSHAPAAAAGRPADEGLGRVAEPDGIGPFPERGAADSTPTTGAVKSLDRFLDVDKVRGLPEREVTALWRLRHANSPRTVCAVMPAATYQAMAAAARRSPQFVLPVPHEGQGAEMHFLQWTFDAASASSTVLFTQLAEYKSRGEFAQPHTTVTHHLDLAGERGLVLMQGQVMEGRGVEPGHARWLVLCLQRFYGAWDGGEGGLAGEAKERAEQRRRLLQWFASGDSRFTVEKLLDEAERMG